MPCPPGCWPGVQALPVRALPLCAGQRLEGPSTEPLSEMDRRQRELYAKQQQLLREQRTADQEKLLAAISDNLGFHQGRPVAAVTIFRCCLQWKTFQADRTPLFDKIISTMGSQVGPGGLGVRWCGWGWVGVGGSGGGGDRSVGELAKDAVHLRCTPGQVLVSVPGQAASAELGQLLPPGCSQGQLAPRCGVAVLRCRWSCTRRTTPTCPTGCPTPSRCCT